METIYSGIQCFVAELDKEIRAATTQARRDDLITKAHQRARTQGFSEEEIDEIHVILMREWRRYHKSGTPGKKRSPKGWEGIDAHED